MSTTYPYNGRVEVDYADQTQYLKFFPKGRIE